MPFPSVSITKCYGVLIFMPLSIINISVSLVSMSGLSLLVIPSNSCRFSVYYGSPKQFVPPADSALSI